MTEKKLILGASIGNCVHVAGVIHFLQIAETEGFDTVFLGPAVPIEKLFDAIEELRPDTVSVGYRLTPENAALLLEEIAQKRIHLTHSVRWTFGGTPPVAEVAKKYDFFEFISDGYDDVSDSIRYFRGFPKDASSEDYGRTLLERIKNTYPYPIIRHHFGLPSLKETIDGIELISDAKVLDVISLGPDQNAQQFFFKPESMQRKFDGAGGVPVRTASDFSRLKKASLRGNFPLMRCYSGTEDVFEYAEMLVDTIDNAWCAVPLCWYNELDGRGTRTIEHSLKDAMQLMRWHAERNIPVEVNEPHHWGLRDSHDAISVAMAYISAYNAKHCGVQNYIAQYMFNTPNGLSFSMDFAKVLAMDEMVQSLADPSFNIFKETRAGLALFNADENVAKGQLAASTFMQMNLMPHIIHVVGFCEADHAATASEVIASCRIAKGVIRHCVDDRIDIQHDPAIAHRKNELISEASTLIEFIQKEYGSSLDPLCDPEVLADCIKKGYLDAVHIMKNNKFQGNLRTRLIDGKCVAIDSADNPISEKERLSALISGKTHSSI